MPDPVTIAVIAAGVGGTAGKLVEKTWDAGAHWLAEYFSDHNPEAQQQASRNALGYLNELAQRVDALEKEAEDTPEANRIEDAQNDPDFAALLRESLLAGARTNDSEKHALLGRLVSERLRFAKDSLVSLTVPLAAAAVPRLTKDQLRFLGLATLVDGIRPTPFAARPDDPGQTWYTSWLEVHLTHYHPMPILQGTHLTHLQSLSCATSMRFMSKDLKKTLTTRAIEPFDWDFDNFTSSTRVGPELVACWRTSLQHVVLTNTGQLVGIYVHDELTRMRTRINWDTPAG